MPTAPQLHFWNWDAPVLPKVVAELTRDWNGGELDLSRTIILVPTAEAVRRLREALAVAVAYKAGAVVAPHVWHPESALMHGVDRGTILTPLQEQLVWRAVLENLDLAGHAALFPTEPAASRDAWAAGVGETLGKLRDSVAAGGCSLADVAGKSDNPDAARWKELAALEFLYLTKANELGLRDAQEVKRERAAAPVLPPDVERLCVFALADATPLLKQWIQNAAAEVTTQVFVHAPANRADGFDEVGRPLVEVWREVSRNHIELGGDQLHLAADLQQQAQTAMALMRRCAEQGQGVALGLADPLLAPPLEGALSEEGVRAFDPAGRKAARHALLEVLRAWLKLAQSRTFRSLAAFLRLEDVLRVVTTGAKMAALNFLETLDEFYVERLPPTLKEAVILSAQPLPGRLIPNEDAPAGESPEQKRQREKDEALQKLNAVLRDVEARLEAWKEAEPGEALRGFLEWIYGDREFMTEAEDDRGYTVLFGKVTQFAEEVRVVGEKLKSAASTTALAQTLVRTLQETQLPDTRGEIDLVLQGWLELLWEPAEALVVCGFNDENVPGKIAPDPFLPDHVREFLGLACQASRRARDAYLLTALAAQRRQQGALHLVMGQTNNEGDVLRPSRLLFACEDPDLPSRVELLFPKELPAPPLPQPAHSIAWQLAPWRVTKGLNSVTVSLLASYLRCPLRCGLERFFGMEAVVASQREMTGGDFGVLVHEVLAAFGREEQLRDSRSEMEIQKFFNETLDALVMRRWGARPLLSTLLQVEAARQRLAHAAAVQARLREQGWRIKEVELDITEKSGLTIAGVPFKGRLDRIDEHVETQVLRVWDYKTRNKAEKPLKAHSDSLKGAALEDEALEWKSFTAPDGKPRVWTDLQLPLYVWALRALRPGVPGVEAGYIHLPKAVTDSEEEIWTDLTESLVESAVGCAEEAVRRMKAGIFWPPAEDLKFDAYDELLLGNAPAAVLDPSRWKESAA